MATRFKEGVHLKEKSFSATSTPGRTSLSDGRQTTADYPMEQEKPLPNYLKPTVTSCHNTSCRYRKSQQQHSEDPMTAATTRKRLISTKSMEKPDSPSSLPHKTPPSMDRPGSPSSLTHKTSKERTPRSSFSLKPTLSPKVVPEKVSKVPISGKTLTRAKSLPKRLPKRKEVNGSSSTTTAIKLEQEGKDLSIAKEVQSHAAGHGSQTPKGNSEGKQWTTSEESDAGKPEAPPVKVAKRVYSNGVPRKLKFQQGRELVGQGKKAVDKRLKSRQSGKGVEVEGEGRTEPKNLMLKWQDVKEKVAPPACIDVIEETPTRLAMRRNKVKALVGAFESVISLEEHVSHPTQHEEVVMKVGRVDQPSQPRPEKKVKVGEEGAERGQPGRVKPEKEVKGGEKCAKGCQPAKQQPNKKVKDEEENSEEQSKGVIWVERVNRGR